MSDRVAPGDDLPARYQMFERVRNEDYPARISEYRIEDGEKVFVAATPSATTETTSLRGDDLLVLAPDARRARRSLAEEVVAWSVASAIFLLPAVVWLYSELAA